MDWKRIDWNGGMEWCYYLNRYNVDSTSLSRHLPGHHCSLPYLALQNLKFSWKQFIALLTKQWSSLHFTLCYVLHLVPVILNMTPNIHNKYLNIDIAKWRGLWIIVLVTLPEIYVPGISVKLLYIEFFLNV